MALTSFTEVSPFAGTVSAETSFFDGLPRLEHGETCLRHGLQVCPSLVAEQLLGVQPRQSFVKGAVVLKTTTQEWIRGKCMAGSDTASIWQLQVKTKQGKTRWQASVAFTADDPWGLIHVVEGRYGQSHSEEENHALSLLNFLTVELECRLALGYLRKSCSYLITTSFEFSDIV